LKLCDSKLLQTAINFSGYSVEVNRTFDIKPEPMTLYSEKLQKFVEIPIPMSHIGEKPIKCRLLSSTKRMGMVCGVSRIDGELIGIFVDGRRD
jgi:hypothetical protein